MCDICPEAKKKPEPQLRLFDLLIDYLRRTKACNVW